MLERYGHGGDLLTAEETYGKPREAFIDFSSNMNPFGPPPSVRRLCESFWTRVAEYPDPAVRGLRGKLSAVYGIPAESILVGNGAAELIDLTVRHLQPQLTGLARPSFTEYEEAVHKTGGRILDIPLLPENGFVPEEEAVQDAFLQADLLFLGHPNNPTGQLLPPHIVKHLHEGRAKIVLDEAFIDFIPREERISLIHHAAQSRKLFVIRSMTKFYAIPGIRLGFMVAHPDQIAAIRRLQVKWSVNGLAQQIGEAVLEETEYAASTRQWLQEERGWLAEELRKAGLRVYPGDANYLLFSFPPGSGWTARAAQKKLGRQGILIRDASLFKGLDSAYCRVAVKLREDNGKLVSALRGLMKRAGGR